MNFKWLYIIPLTCCYSQNDKFFQFGEIFVDEVTAAVEVSTGKKFKIDKTISESNKLIKQQEYTSALIELKNLEILISNYNQKDRKEYLSWHHQAKKFCETKLNDENQKSNKRFFDEIKILQKSAYDLAEIQSYKKCMTELLRMDDLVRKSTLANREVLLLWSERLKTFCESKLQKRSQESAQKNEIENLKAQLVEKDKEIKDLKNKLAEALNSENQKTSNPNKIITKAPLPQKKTPQAKIEHTGGNSAKTDRIAEKLDLPKRKLSNPTVQKRLEQLKNKIESGVDPNSMIDTQYNDKITLLGNEVQNGFWQTVEYLIEAGAIIEAPTGLSGFNGGANALQVACLKGDFDIIRILIENGFDPNLTTPDQRTRSIALALNSRIPSSEILFIIKYLNANGAEIDYLTDGTFGKESFAMDAIGKPDPSFIIYALEKNSPIHIKNDGENILELSLEYGRDRNVKSIEAFLQRTENAYLNDKHFFSGNTPLNLVTWSNFEETALLFINNGADVNTVNKNGSTPLMGASRNGNNKLMEHLIDKGANVNANNNEFKTPLHYASEEGEFQAVILLLKNHANRFVLDNEGKTPLDLAKENLSIIKAFEKY